MEKFIAFFIKKRIVALVTIVCFFGACPGIAAIPALAMESPKDFSRKPLGFRIDQWPINPLGFDFDNAIADSKSFELLPPCKADLASSEAVVINEKIRDFVRDLNYDPELIFDYVYNNLKTEFYYGVRNNSIKTLHANKASPWEQCVLLAALLRAAGYHTRFVEGIMTRTGEEIKSWTGAKNPYAAGMMLGKRYIPIASLSESCSNFMVKQPGVMAYIEDEWIIFDPSYKDYRQIEGYDAEIETGQKMEFLVSSICPDQDSILIDPNLIKNSLEEQEGIFNNAVGHLTPNEFFGSSEIIQHPAEKERGVDLNRWMPVKEFSSLPEEFIAKMEVVLPGGDFCQRPISEFTEQLSIVYLPDEYKEGYLKPVLKLGAEVVAIGTPATSGENQEIRVGFFETGKEGWEYMNVGLNVGHKNVHVLTPNIRQEDAELREKAEELKTFSDSLKEEEEKLGAEINASNEKIIRLENEINRISEDISLSLSRGKFPNSAFLAPLIQEKKREREIEIARKKELEDSLTVLSQDNDLKLRTLSLTGKMYFFLKRKNVDAFSKMTKIDNVSAMSLALTSWTGDGVEINIVRYVSRPMSLQETQDDDKGAEIKSWLMTTAMLGSTFESLVFEVLFETNAVSTASSFVEAMKQGISVVVLKKLEDLEKFFANDEVKDAIKTHLKQGFEVAVLERPIIIGDLEQQAWIVIDSAMKSIAFQIDGVGIINGGKTADLNFSEDSAATAGHVALAALETIDSLVVFETMVLAGGMKIWGGTKIAIYGYYSGLALGTVLVGLGATSIVIGTIFIGVACVVGYQLMDNVYNFGEFWDDYHDYWDDYLDSNLNNQVEGRVIIGQPRIVDDYVYDGGDWNFDGSDVSCEGDWHYGGGDWNHTGGDWNYSGGEWSFDGGGDYYYDIGDFQYYDGPSYYDYYDLDLS